MNFEIIPFPIDVNIPALQRLHDGVKESERFEFNMGRFRDATVTQSKLDCGSVACLLGYAPTIPGLEPKREHFDRDNNYSGSARVRELQWAIYCRDTFGITVHSEAWDWLFSGTWRQSLNGGGTKKSSLARLQWSIDNGGIPSNQQQQRRNQAPLCYKTP